MSKINRSTQLLDWQFGSNSLSAVLGYEKIKLNSAPKDRQVLLIGNSNAFADGIMNLLGSQPNLSTRYAKYLDEASVLRDVKQKRPDVVVLLLSRAMNPEIIVGMLMSIQAMTHLRLIILSLETNKIEIYETENTTNQVYSANINLVEVDDFLVAINKNWNAISGHPIH